MPAHPLIITLRQARQAQRRSQFDVVSDVGCAAHCISRWETGKAPPTFRNFVAWANALDIEVVLIPRPRK